MPRHMPKKGVPSSTFFLITALIPRITSYNVCYTKLLRLGMQLVFDISYEGGEFEGLGLINGEIKRFDIPCEFKVPHIGWNKLNTKDSILFSGIEGDIYTYFVHSYHAVTQKSDVIIATSNYGTEFTAAVNKDNIFATQFHPEKSGSKGLQMLQNFAKI